MEHSFDLATFKKAYDKMIAKNDKTWRSMYGYDYTSRLKEYSLEEVNNIINSTSLVEQQKLSRNYFEKSGLYSRIIYHYATLLVYAGLLIPNPSYGKQLSTPHIAKRYYSATEYVDRMSLPEVMTRMSIRVLVDGTYYGIIQTLTKDDFVLFDLPSTYCRSRYVDLKGNEIIEFDVAYFNNIIDLDLRREALSTYPKVVANYYNRWSKGKEKTSWMRIPSEIGVCFSIFNARPLFLETIPATIRYDDAVDRQRERELEEIKKIIVQKIPHMPDGSLLFEPDEAEVIHRGTVGMMKGNKNISVLTTYADVDAIVSKTSVDNDTSSLDKMKENIYTEAGVSSQVFATVGAQTLMLSIINDMSLMMILARKYARFVSRVINQLFSNSNISFTYKILPLSLFNRSDFITDTLKLAQSGYSYLLPAIASGLNQREIVGIKSLENDVLELKDVFIPLSSSYTESQGKVGAPEKKLEDKAEKTIKNEESIDRQGQGGS